MEESTTFFSLQILDPNGVDVRSLFPALHAGALTFLSLDQTSMDVFDDIRSVILTGTGLATVQKGVAQDASGYLTAATFYSTTTQPAVQTAQLSITLGGNWTGTGVPLFSGYGLSPNSLLNAASTGSPVHLDELGGQGPDKLWGSDYGDFLNGEGGRDTLTGNAGDDTFFFDGTPGKANLDHIGDFSHGHDTLKFDTDWYGALIGVTLKKAFHDITNGMGHEDKNDRLLYNHKTGYLYYDPDGDHGGGKHDANPVHVATLDNHANLTYQDLLVF